MDQLIDLLSSQSNDTEANVVALGTKNADRLISDWYYAANTSNQTKFGSSTLALASLFSLPSFPKELSSRLCRNILQGEIKTIYRALTGLRQNHTIPILTLLRQIARIIPQDLVIQFDFTLRVIPKILSQQPYRQSFLEFYIELIQSASPQTRRELFANRKVFSGWIGKLGREDSEENVLKTLDILHSCVLKDTVVFTKTTKMGLFNDWTLKNMQRILAESHSEKVSEQISRFVVVLLCDRKYGVRLPGENRLALSFLKIVKPWENVTQMNLVVRILKEVPDLMVPYFDSLASAYPLTPKQSMWWFSYSVLHIRVLKLDAYIDSVHLPKIDAMSLQVLPKTINKQTLQQCLQFDSALVKFQAIQIMLFGVQRMSRVIDAVYNPKKWDSKPLIDEFLSRLPDFGQLTKLVEPPLLRITSLAVIKGICHLRPIQICISLPLEAKEVVGLDLVQAEHILEIQTHTSDQTKWWQSQQGQISLFTQLCQFATFNFQLSRKASKLLQHLVSPTQMFAEMKPLTHPVDALLYSLSLYHSPLVWNIIEQAVQRVVRSPYKYIDKVQSNKISPFLVAVYEQFQFLVTVSSSGDKSKVSSWLNLFFTTLMILGEDSKISTQFLSQLDSVSRPLDEFFDFVLYASDSQLLGRQDLVYKVSNRLELAALIHRTIQTENAKLRNHLLANIPLDMHFDLLNSNMAFSPFLHGSYEQCRSFFIALELNRKVITIQSGQFTEFKEALEQCDHWILGLPLVSTEFLLEKLDNDYNPAILHELNTREYRLELSKIRTIIDFAANGDVLRELSVNIGLWEPATLNDDIAKELLVSVDLHPQLIASLVRACGIYEPTHPLSLSPEVLIAACNYAPSQVDIPMALKAAVSMLKQENPAALTILAEFHTHIEPSSFIWDLVSEYIEQCKRNSRSVLHIDLLKLIRNSNFVLPFLSRWLKIAVHQITKQFAEAKITNFDFINLLCQVISSNSAVNPWQYVHHNAINAMLEAALKYDKPNVSVFDLVSCLSSLKSTNQETLAQLTILFETKKPSECTLEESIAIYFLFFNNSKHNSTLEVEQAILSRYTGSVSAKDRILLSILEGIESVRQRSWIDQVESWDVKPAVQTARLELIDDYGREPLVEVKNGKLSVTLDEQRIRHTTQIYEVIPKWQLDLNNITYVKMKAASDQYEVNAPDFADQIYDSWFMLPLVISCEFLFDNLEIFLSSGILSFVICCISNDDLTELAFQVLKRIYSKLDDDSRFKDQVGLKLLVGKLLMMESVCRKQGLPVPSHIPGIVGQIALVLSKPTHFLYEKVCQWLLASPQIHTIEIPLFKSVLGSSSNMKLREMLWLVNCLKSGAVDAKAVNLYTKYGIIEWCFSQLTLLDNRTSALKEAVIKFIKRMEEIPSVSNVLITKSAALTIPEENWRLLYSAGTETMVNWAVS